MSRVHDSLKDGNRSRRPIRSRNASVPSVLVSDTQPTDGQADDPVGAVPDSIHQLESRLKTGIMALQQENSRLSRENQQLRARLGLDGSAG